MKFKVYDKATLLNMNNPNIYGMNSKMWKYCGTVIQVEPGRDYGGTYYSQKDSAPGECHWNWSINCGEVVNEDTSI